MNLHRLLYDPYRVKLWLLALSLDPNSPVESHRCQCIMNVFDRGLPLKLVRKNRESLAQVHICADCSNTTDHTMYSTFKTLFTFCPVLILTFVLNTVLM